jgi:hypothetical protein
MPKPTLALITKPSIPEFTVEVIDCSGDGPRIYFIELKVKNQQFTPYEVQESPQSANWTIEFYYNIQVKERNGENWISFHSPLVEPLKPSNSDYTVLSFRLSPTHPAQGFMLESYDATTDSYSEPSLSGLPFNPEIDFRFEAMTGYVHRGYNPNATDQLQMWPWIFTGETSGWSNTQTIAIDENDSTTNTNMSLFQNPSVLLAIVSAVSMASASIGLLVYFKKRHTKSIGA